MVLLIYHSFFRAVYTFPWTVIQRFSQGMKCCIMLNFAILLNIVTKILTPPFDWHQDKYYRIVNGKIDQAHKFELYRFF